MQGTNRAAIGLAGAQPGWMSGTALARYTQQAGLRNFSGPGHWNGMDMLAAGKGISEDEDKAHFSICVRVA